MTRARSTQTPIDMIGVLQEYWAEVFRERGIDEAKLKGWLEERYPAEAIPTRALQRNTEGQHHWRVGLPTEASQQWEVKKSDLANSIKQSKNSAPGPDGLPHKVWRELGGFGLDILWDAMQELHEECAPALLHEAYGTDHTFNEGCMVCLPKSSSEINGEGVDIYEAANTRPLAIGNTDNRILCGAARRRWEKIFNNWISPHQKGFIRGRSMLSNVLTIDSEAMKVSLKEEHGGMILFDFKAAFPSIERKFMIDTLRWLGRPVRQLRFIEMIYDRTIVKLKLAGVVGDYFAMNRGIRQGCPLSPLIFAVVVNILLRKLANILQTKGLTRAFADDTAMVLRNLFMSFSTVAHIFDDYALISGLHLNFAKTVVIPLWREQEESWEVFRQVLTTLGNGWENVKITDVAKYLGFLVGPGRDEAVWNKATGKWQSSSKWWSQAGVGLQFSAMIYNVFCASTLYFLAQMEVVPKHPRQGAPDHAAAGQRPHGLGEQQRSLAHGPAVRDRSLLPLHCGEVRGRHV